MSDHKPPCHGPQDHTHKSGRPSCTSHCKDSNPAYQKPDRRIRVQGEACTRLPMKGQNVCYMHGGQSSQAVAGAEKRLAEQAARKQMARLGLPDPIKISAIEAMVWAISAKYAEVVWLRSIVQSIDTDDLVWGKTRVKKGGDDHGTTKEAVASVWWQMLRGAEDQLVKYAATARARNVDEATVTIAEQQGQMLGQFLDGLMAAMLAALIQEGVTTAEFPVVWARCIRELFPKHFRTLGRSNLVVEGEQ